MVSLCQTLSERHLYIYIHIHIYVRYLQRSSYKGMEYGYFKTCLKVWCKLAQAVACLFLFSIVVKSYIKALSI